MNMQTLKYWGKKQSRW